MACLVLCVATHGLNAPLAKAPPSAIERALLASTSNAETLKLVQALEARAPPRDDLLDVPDAAALLDGRWALRSTVAATVGEDDLEETGQAGVVNASGIRVNAAPDRCPVQEVRVADGRRVSTHHAPPARGSQCAHAGEPAPHTRTTRAGGRIGNDVLVNLPKLPFLRNASCYIRVSGALSRAPPPATGRRAVVSFDSLGIYTASGRRRMLSAGWIFRLLRRFSPSLLNGADDR